MIWDNIIGTVFDFLIDEDDEQMTDEEQFELQMRDLDHQFPVETAIGKYSCGLISKDELINIYLKEHPKE